MPALGFLNPSFQSVAKVQSGAQTKLRFASLRAVLTEEERRNNGACKYRDALSHSSAKPPLYYCDITRYPAAYVDAKTGLHYTHVETYQYIQNLERGQVMQFQELQHFVSMEERMGFQ